MTRLERIQAAFEHLLAIRAAAEILNPPPDLHSSKRTMAWLQVRQALFVARIGLTRNDPDYEEAEYILLNGKIPGDVYNDANS